MHLTKLERLLLLHQCSILAALRPTEAAAHASLVEILSGGFKLYYGEALRHLHDDMPEEESLLVLRTLHLYDALDAFGAAHPDHAIHRHPWGRFRGFDAQLEPQHHAFASFVLRRLGKFPAQLARLGAAVDAGAGEPALPHVKPMTVTWEAQGEPTALGEEQVSAILHAAGA